MKSIRNLLPSFILIAIYFIADEFFGPEIGLICAIVLGAAEFTYTRIKEGVNDKMVLLTTLFFCIPGGIAIVAQDSGIEKMQPVIIELALCSLLGFLAFSKTDMLSTMPAAYRKTMHITPEQQKVMRNMIKILFFIICAHIALASAALFHLDQATASFIKGPLLYILLALFFIAVLVRNKIQMHKLKHEEWLPVVNEKGEVTGKAPRSLCHSGSKLLHPVVHLHIINDKHQLFLQKRSMKKNLLPGKWDTAVGGHIGLNEKIEDALKRETFEELGITDFEAQFLGSYLWESPREKELVFSFLCKRHNEIKIDNDEVDEGRFWKPDEIENNIDRDLFTPNFLHEYRLNLKKILNHR